MGKSTNWINALNATGLTPGVVAAALLLLSASAAASHPVDVYSVFWAADTTDKATIETFFGCLASSSSFGGAWANEWGVGPVRYHGVTVLNAKPPDPLQMDASLTVALAAAFDAGALAKPGKGYSSIYVVHGPATVSVRAANGTVLCTDAAQACGVHDLNQYNGLDYQVALVPLACARCGGTLQSATWIGEHELGEALGWEGSGGFENGDGCEGNGNLTKLACCGANYVIQQMARPAGKFDCETIVATGAQCVCGVAQVACAGPKSCCAGLACQTWVANIGDAPKNVCCDETSKACGETNDCCGGLSCQNGKCVCEAEGKFCLRDEDCCNQGICVGDKCAPRPMPDLAAIADLGANPTDGQTRPDGKMPIDGANAAVMDSGKVGSLDASADSPPGGCSFARSERESTLAPWLAMALCAFWLRRRRKTSKTSGSGP